MAEKTMTALHSKTMRLAAPRIRASWIVYAVLIAGCIVTVVPFVYTILASFKTHAEIIDPHQQSFLPRDFTTENYETIFDDPTLPIERFYLNSILVAVSTVFTLLFSSALFGFVFAKYQFRYKRVLFGYVLLTMMIPGVLFLIPTYVLMYRIGWVGHFEALIVPSIVSVFNIFLIRQFMSGIPDELVEAARIDGAGEMVIFTRIILPLARPALATVAILTFMGSWNDFFGPLLYLNRPEQWTLQLGLLQFRGTVPGENAQQIWALTTIITVPIVVVYFFIQEQFVKAFANVSLSK
ncbi:MAG: carbohydrate ABC transporter permease [Anaerolineae bacterium]|nr:MAG: carbohydrate ABC transporter permease [Anaerolineae bacterium]